MKDLRSIAGLVLATATLLAVGLACSGKFETNSASSTSNSSNSGSTSSNTGAKPAPAEKKKTDIAGTYDATGSNPDGGGQYESELTIKPHGDVYQFSWVSGKLSYDGVGVMTDGEVAVAYTSGNDGKGCGVVLYKVAADGTLDGKFGYWGVDTIETETAKRTTGSGSDLDGVYDITGKNPDGKEYKGKLTVARSGDGYTFDWEAGNSFSGFGIRADEYVAVGFGGKQCAFVGYDVQSDGTLEGKWGSQASRKFGTETAKPRK